MLEENSTEDEIGIKQFVLSLACSDVIRMVMKDDWQFEEKYEVMVKELERVSKEIAVELYDMLRKSQKEGGEFNLDRRTAS
jgi:hypothetical protein